MKTYRMRRWEQSTVGFDAELQLVGSDAQGGAGWMGLPIPSAVPASAQGRYTFLLAIAEFGIGERAALVGMRQYLEMKAQPSTGSGLPNFPLRCVIQTPGWRFVDANVTFGLRRIRPMNPGTANAQNSDGMQWRLGNAPSQLFETITTVPGHLPVTYPPFAGGFPGEAFEPSLAQFYDVRFPWVSDSSAGQLSVPVTGPCQIALFASVMQSNPSARITIPGTPPFLTTSGISPEDAFVGNNPTAIYSRIAGSLIFDQHEGGPRIKPGSEKFPRRRGAPSSALERSYDKRQQ